MSDEIQNLNIDDTTEEILAEIPLESKHQEID